MQEDWRRGAADGKLKVSEEFVGLRI